MYVGKGKCYKLIIFKCLLKINLVRNNIRNVNIKDFSIVNIKIKFRLQKFKPIRM